MKFSLENILRINREMNCHQQCSFVKEEDIASGKWIKLNQITYKDPTGKERVWEAVQRTTKLPGVTTDAVVSIPILRRTLYYDCTILVKQYRPPMKKYTIEFPAGLLDANETVEQCALRELKEETGYNGTVKHVSPVTALDPGIGDATAQFVTIEVDGDFKENQNPVAHQDDGEFIEVLVVPFDDLLAKLNEYAAAGLIVDSRIYSYAIALEQTKKLRNIHSANI